MESILRLGMMYQDHGYEELSDMEEIVKFMEEGLMRTNWERRSERLRMTDYFQMGQEQWKWDEYDEIWGFDNVLQGANHLRDLNGLRNRQAGIPDQLEEEYLENFYARMERRRITRERTGYIRRIYT